MRLLKSFITTPIFLKIFIGLLFVILPFGGFFLGRQYQSGFDATKRDTFVLDADKSFTDNVFEMNIWISPDNNKKLIVKQDKRTYSGDLYYSFTFYDAYLNKISNKVVKVLDIGKRLPGVNFGSPLWYSDKFIIELFIGDTRKTYLCFTDGSPAKELSLEQSFQTEEYIISWLNDEKVLGLQKKYKEPTDRVDLPENYTLKYWIAPISDLSKKTFIMID